MSLDSDMAVLRRVALFGDLPSEPLRLLAFSAGRRELAPHQVLFRAGDVAHSGFVVAEGAIQMSSGAKRKTLATCEAGTLIGELALLVETRRPATAASVGNSVVLEIDRTLIIRMLNEFPRVAVKWRATMSERLMATVDELGKVRKALGPVDRAKVRR